MSRGNLSSKKPDQFDQGPIVIETGECQIPMYFSWVNRGY